MNGFPCLKEPVGTFQQLVDEIVKTKQVSHLRLGKLDHLSQLGFVMSDILLHETKPFEKTYCFKRGIVFGNSVSSLDTDLKYWESTRNIASPALFVYTLPNIVLAEISIKNNFKGESFFFISEKIDVKLLFNTINDFFSTGRLDICLGGWIDVLNGEYDAFVFLAEKEKPETDRELTVENLIKIYNTIPVWSS